jgi:toxin secretion/phage lysis holin
MTTPEIVAKTPLSILLAFVSYMTGVFSELLMILLVVQVLDYTTGILRAILTWSLNSTVGLKGIMKKMTMIIIVGLAACIEYIFVFLDFNTHSALVGTVICFFIVNEGISVLENSAQLGVPIPEKLYVALSKLREIGGKEQRVTKRKSKIK